MTFLMPAVPLGDGVLRGVMMGRSRLSVRDVPRWLGAVTDPPVTGLSLVAVLGLATLLGQSVPMAFPASGARMASAGACGATVLFQADDVSAWCLERNDTLIIPDRLLAHPRPMPARFRQAGVPGRSAANLNANPLNIKLGSETRWHIAMGVAIISTIVPLDGGRFLKFDSPESGFRAAVALLAAPGYCELSVDQALRKWSNNGYGAEIVQGTLLSARKVVADLTDRDLKVLLAAMAMAEGYRSATLGTEIQQALGN